MSLNKEHTIGPDFLIIGAMKSGSSSIAVHCSKHKEIAIPKREVHFFDQEVNYQKGIDWYDKELKNHATFNTKTFGEKTPAYMYYESCASLIKKMNPNLKLVWIFRNPIERSYSHYWHAVKKGNEKLSFEKAIQKEIKDYNSVGEFNRYLERGDYQKFIKIYLKYFSEDQMHFIKFEDFKDKPIEILNKLFDFLEVDSNNFKFQNKISNKTNLPKFPLLLYYTRQVFGKDSRAFDFVHSRLKSKKFGYPKMEKNTELFLSNYFQDKNAELTKLIGMNVSDWNIKSIEN